MGTKRVQAAAVLALAALAPVAATGQTVVGQVVEEDAERPLAGAFVVLEDSAGVRHGAVLAGDDGRFVVRAPSPGRYRLVARLIGYADQASGLFRLAADETVERRLEVRIRAISLEGIRAEVGKRCRRGPDGSDQTARLWDEARKALEIAEWGETGQALRFRIVRHRRELDARTLKVTAIQETGQRGYFAESPYQSIPAERLEAAGYIQDESRDGVWDHFAPDGEVLLSGSFLDTHCFRVEGGDGSLVGLGFEPVAGRDLPDIRGTLWLDRGSAELRRLDFRYVNLPYPHDDWPQVGGMVEFERLGTGMWIVRRWYIRMPLGAERTGGYGGDRARLSLRSLVEDGAEVTQVRERDGGVLVPSPPRPRPGVPSAADTAHR
jgi:hypothetical protein